MSPCSLIHEPPSDAQSAIPRLVRATLSLPRSRAATGRMGLLHWGGPETARGFARLKEQGIRTIVDLRTGELDVPALRGLGLRYLCLPCDEKRIRLSDVLVFLKAVTDTENQPVYVHCNDEGDHTGVMVALYRLFVDCCAADASVSPGSTSRPSSQARHEWHGIIDAELERIQSPYVAVVV